MKSMKSVHCAMGLWLTLNKILAIYSINKGNVKLLIQWYCIVIWQHFSSFHQMYIWDTNTCDWNLFWASISYFMEIFFIKHRVLASLYANLSPLIEFLGGHTVFLQSFLEFIQSCNVFLKNEMWFRGYLFSQWSEIFNEKNFGEKKIFEQNQILMKCIFKE